VTTLERAGQVEYIPVSAVVPNPYQPRREFDDEALRELVNSIREVGILQPVLVRRLGAGYELVAGERRLRAARLAGLQELPALVIHAVPEDSAALALVENLQRSDLSFWEEAEAYQRLIRDFNWTQEQVARRVGKSQGAVANKLRLLRLEPEVRRVLEQEGLSERHARALLSLPGGGARLRAAMEMAGRRLSVRESERLVDKAREGAGGVRRGAIRDVRIVLNTLKRALEPLARHGIRAEIEEGEQDRYWVVTVRIPKR
jgi:ParB family chromosome partitioning protein